VAEVNLHKMVTKFSVWNYNETEKKWYGTCVECKGKIAQYTLEALKKENLKPCPLCTTLDKNKTEETNES